MRIIFIVLLVSIIALSCTSQETQNAEENNIMKLKRLETLREVKLQDDHIEITVTGHGCTLLEHFDIQIEEDSDECRVSIYRIRPDFCRRAPLPITLKLPWNAKQVCGDASIKIVNAIKPHVSGLNMEKINRVIRKDHTTESAK